LDSDGRFDVNAVLNMVNYSQNMLIPNDYYLLIDLEATCSNDESLPRHEMEIIEIGAVMQNARTFEVVSEFQTFICPIRHPRLTAFCTELTTITQADVDQAPRFPVALAAMQEWMYQFDNSLFCSWGDYDHHQFVQDCGFHGVGYPFLSGHLNLKPEFSRSLDIKKKLGLAQALRHLGLDFAGTHHRGIDDARNIARIVRAVCSRST
jgi:inhibitor of KinA sporulation pathway (predicted exonuclease)